METNEPLTFAEYLYRKSDWFRNNNNNNNKEEHRLVLGNPAGDADSIVSALALSYVDYLLDETSIVPVVSVSSHDLPLRRETMVLLRMVGIHHPDRLVAMDHISGPSFALTLVDHNRIMHPELLSSNSYVQEILDHHMDEGCYREEVPNEKRVIAFENQQATVASTCTLVVERWLQKKKDASSLPSDVALALLGVILLDSVNMSESAGKGTPRDQKAIDALLHQTNWKTLRDDVPDTNTLYETLMRSKTDPVFWKGLSVRDTLRLDYKQFTGKTSIVFGASSILLSLDDFLQKPLQEEEIRNYMKEQGVSLLLVLSTVVVGPSSLLQRSMLVCGIDPGTTDALTTFLCRDPTLDAAKQDETTTTRSNALTVHRLKQGNPKASRKQVVPILFRFFEQPGDKR